MSLINISEILDDPLFVEPIEVGITTRIISEDTGLPYESVAWQTVKANVQTVSDDQLQRLPDAERYKPSRQFFSNQVELREGDYFKEFGKVYRCIADQDFKKHGYSDCIGILYNGAEVIKNGDEDIGFNPPKVRYFGMADREFLDNHGFNVGEFTDADR